MELYQAIVKLDLDGKPDDIQARVDRIQADLEDQIKALNEHSKMYGLRGKPTLLVKLPFGWQVGIQEGAAVWDENWDSLKTRDIIHDMPHDAHPMGILVSAMSALFVFHPDANPALRAPTIVAAAYLRMAGRPPVLPSSNLSYSENFLYMLDSLGEKSYKPNPRLARVLDILFILHVEHEMNCSTAAARHLASSGVDVYTALAGAVGALYGISMVEPMRKWKMSGFGHRVYENYDPRAKVIKKLVEEVFSIVDRDPLIKVAIALEQAALSDKYFVKRRLYRTLISILG